MKRLAALAEILLILALGNILGEAIFGAIAPDSSAVSDIAAAANEGLLIFLRLGLAGLLGLLLLYYRRGVTPRQAGLSRNGQPLARLLWQGFLLGILASFLVSGLFVVHRLVPFGEGLPAWWTYSETPVDTAFWVRVLGTSVLIPPLTEEIMTRGYFRVRLVESYGPMSGVILAGLVFGLAHTRYLAGDSMLLLFMLIILLNSICWTYLAQKTGSIIPAFVAHAISNGIGTAVLFNVWLPFALVSAGVVVFHRPLLAILREFLVDLRQDRELPSLWQGVGMVLAILVISLILLNLFGRQVTLLALGLFSLSVTLVALVREKRPHRVPAS